VGKGSFAINQEMYKDCSGEREETAAVRREKSPSLPQSPRRASRRSWGRGIPRIACKNERSADIWKKGRGQVSPATRLDRQLLRIPPESIKKDRQLRGPLASVRGEKGVAAHRQACTDWRARSKKKTPSTTKVRAKEGGNYCGRPVPAVFRGRLQSLAAGLCSPKEVLSAVRLVLITRPSRNGKKKGVIFSSEPRIVGQAPVKEGKKKRSAVLLAEGPPTQKEESQQHQRREEPLLSATAKRVKRKDGLFPHGTFPTNFRSRQKKPR